MIDVPHDFEIGEKSDILMVVVWCNSGRRQARCGEYSARVRDRLSIPALTLLKLALVE
jgi:hypothetical protein